jgi:AraC-like DNA-binding protein
MKPKSILPFNLNLRTELINMEVDAIDNDIILLEKAGITLTSHYPFRVDVTAIIVCMKGITEGSINLKPCRTEGACLITILPGQILEYKSVSEDFTSLIIVMSSKFVESLIPNVADRLPLMLSVRENPVTPLDNEALQWMIGFFEILKRVIRVNDHPYRLEFVRYQTLAFIYGAGVFFHNVDENRKKTRYDTIVEKYLHLVQTHYKEQRGLDFYAKKLSISRKHLSKVIMETSGKPANDWIDEHVALEAKALLKSTSMTIQQITEELNFPSQSFFGKYFKRVVGMSPREYRGKG